MCLEIDCNHLLPNAFGDILGAVHWQIYMITSICIFTCMSSVSTAHGNRQLGPGASVQFAVLQTIALFEFYGKCTVSSC